MLHGLEIYRDHTTARKEPYIVPQFLQKKRTGVLYRKKGHGDVEGKDDGRSAPNNALQHATGIIGG